MSEVMLSIPRLYKKDQEIKPGIKYINLEEKIREYISRHRGSDMCFLFKQNPKRDADQDQYFTNYTSDIIAKIVAVRPSDVLVQVIDRGFFEKYGGDNLYVRIVSIGEQTDKGIMVNKIVRFETICRKGVIKNET